MKKISKIAAVITAGVMAVSLAISSNNQSITMAETKTSSVINTSSVDKYAMRNITTQQIVSNMGIGWNLGNTLEACGDWINGKTVKDYETAWGMPVTTKTMIDGVHNAGFNSIRIPVAWSNLMGTTDTTYTINSDLLNRVEEVANYALDDNMYVIINIHYDNGWLAGFGDSTKYDQCMKKYKAIWTQISSRFAKYGDHLIFESLNEDGCYDKIWNPYDSSNTGKAQAYGILNGINQAFVDLIRGSGGNNAKRHLLIAGYATSIDNTCDLLYKMPYDPEHRCAVSVHYYGPYQFTLMTKDESWGKVLYTWGTSADFAELDKYMTMMKTNFVDKGIPVIVGEYGLNMKGNEINKDGKLAPEVGRLWLNSVCTEAYKFGMCPMLWDCMSFYNRNAGQFDDPILAAAFKNIIDTVPREGQIIYGDLNNDKSVNTVDCSLMERYILNANTNINLNAADLNGDGVVNSIDLVLLKRYILNQIARFPVAN